MSMENAILEHAAAIRGLTAALLQRAAPLAALADQASASIKAITDDVRGTTHQEAADNQAAIEKDRELEQAVEKVEAAAKEEKKAPAKAEPKVEEKTNEPAAALDYKADVYPKLVALAKAKGKPALVGLLKEFDAANGDALKAEQYSAVVARAAELAV